MQTITLAKEKHIMELELDFTAFKKNLRDLIESRGLYAKDIAAEINVSTPTLSRYLQGVREPELKYVVRLARYFGVSVDWLLGLSNDRYEAVPTEVREFATLYALASPDDRTIVETVLKKYREEN
jgi:transcriptional regulator with XRE-family HTH domain